MKKVVSLLLALIMAFSLVACGEKKDNTVPYKIGIVTGSVSQSEDDRRGAEAFQKEYGEDMVQLAIYPDNFTEETETTIQSIVNLSADPLMKAIIVNQSVPGTTEAFRKIKETRPDIICIAGEAHEDLPEIGSAADLVTNNDFVSRGYLHPHRARAGLRYLRTYLLPPPHVLRDHEPPRGHHEGRLRGVRHEVRPGDGSRSHL